MAISLILFGVSFFFLRKKRRTDRYLQASIFLAILAFVCAFIQARAALEFAQKEGAKISLFNSLFFNSKKDNLPISVTTESYGERAGKDLLLDVYQSKIRGEGGAAIIVVHGGSWHGGRRSDFKADDLWLAGLGYTVFDIDYSLVGDNVHFPIPDDDIESALQWISSHAKTYGIDSTKIALFGRSAGGQLALVSAYKRRPAAVPYKVVCVVAFYAPTDLLWDYDNPLYPDVINARKVIVQYLGEAPAKVSKLCAQASPCYLLSDSSPPTLLIHGGRDQIVSPHNSAMLSYQMKEHHIAGRYLFLPWANHGFDWCATGLSSQITQPVIKHFLEEYL